MDAMLAIVAVLVVIGSLIAGVAGLSKKQGRSDAEREHRSTTTKAALAMARRKTRAKTRSELKARAARRDARRDARNRR